MAKWNRYARGIFILEGSKHFAVVVKRNRSSWYWGVFDGKPYFSGNYPFTSSAHSKEYAKLWAEKGLKKVDS